MTIHKEGIKQFNSWCADLENHWRQANTTADFCIRQYENKEHDAKAATVFLSNDLRSLRSEEPYITQMLTICVDVVREANSAKSSLRDLQKFTDVQVLAQFDTNLTISCGGAARALRNILSCLTVIEGVDGLTEKNVKIVKEMLTKIQASIKILDDCLREIRDLHDMAALQLKQKFVTKEGITREVYGEIHKLNPYQENLLSWVAER